MILAMNFSSSSKELPISQKLQRMVLSMLVNLDQGMSLFIKIGYLKLRLRGNDDFQRLFWRISSDIEPSKSSHRKSKDIRKGNFYYNYKIFLISHI